MSRNVRSYVQRVSCIRKPFQLFSIHLLEPLLLSSRGYILVVCDYFRKLVLSVSLRTSKVPNILHHVENNVLERAK